MLSCVCCVVGVIPWYCVFRLNDVGPSFVVSAVNNNIGIEGAKALAAALPHSRVTSIDLRSECFLCLFLYIFIWVVLW